MTMSDATSPATTTPANEGPRDVEVIELEAAPAEPPGPPPRRGDAVDPPLPLSVRADLAPRAWPPVVLGDIMSRQLLTVNEDEPLGDLETWMKRFRFHHLLVVRAGPITGPTLVGLITRSDLLHAMLGKKPDGTPFDGKVDATTVARTIMRKSVITGKPTTSITTACRVLLQEKLGCLPIVLEDGTLVGIVTESDFARLSLDLLDRKGDASMA